MSNLINTMYNNTTPQITIENICKRVDKLEIIKPSEAYLKKIKEHGLQKFPYGHKNYESEKEKRKKKIEEVKNKVKNITMKYKLQDYCGKNSPYGEGEEGSGDFGSVIENFMIGSGLSTCLEYDLPKTITENTIIYFQYNEQLLKKLQIGEYDLNKFVRGEDAYNKIRSINATLKAYHLPPMLNQDIFLLGQIGSEQTIVNINTNLKYTFAKKHKNQNQLKKLETVFKSDTVLSSQWKESMQLSLFLAERLPLMNEFETVKRDLLDNWLEQYFTDKFATKCPYRYK